MITIEYESPGEYKTIDLEADRIIVRGRFFQPNDVRHDLEPVNAILTIEKCPGGTMSLSLWSTTPT